MEYFWLSKIHFLFTDSDQDPEDVFSQKEKVNSPEPTQCLLPFAKVDDLKRLFKFMPAVDITFIRTFFKEYNNTAVFAKSKKTLQKAKANSKVSETNRKINKGKSKSNTESTKGIKKCKP